MLLIYLIIYTITQCNMKLVGDHERWDAKEWKERDSRYYE